MAGKLVSPKTIIKRWMIANGERKDCGDFIFSDPIIGGCSLCTYGGTREEMGKWLPVLEANGYTAELGTTTDGRIRVRARVKMPA